MDMMQCLYAGLIGDTGSFRFASASASVFEIVADFKRRGLEHTSIHENIYDNFLENWFRFIGHVLSNRLEIDYQLNTALIWVTKQDLLRYQIKTGDTEGLVNYPLGIQGIKLACIVIDRDEKENGASPAKETLIVILLPAPILTVEGISMQPVEKPTIALIQPSSILKK
jgi:phosphoesterase RecJ-like protein